MKKFNMELESKTILMIFYIDMNELSFIQSPSRSLLDLLVKDNKLKCSRQTIEDSYILYTGKKPTICGSSRTLLKYETEGLEQIYQKYLRYNKLNRII